MYAIMLGFVSYFRKDGKLPAHTKLSFYEYGILKIYGIIVFKNAILFMHKVNHFLSSLPQSICKGPLLTITDTNIKFTNIKFTGLSYP